MYVCVCVCLYTLTCFPSYLSLIVLFSHAFIYHPVYKLHVMKIAAEDTYKINDCHLGVLGLWGLGFDTFSDVRQFKFHLSKQYLHYVTLEHFLFVWSLNVGEYLVLSDGQEYRQSQAPVTFSWLQHILHSFTVNSCESYLFQVLHLIFPGYKTKLFSLIIAMSSKLYVSARCSEFLVW